MIHSYHSKITYCFYNIINNKSSGKILIRFSFAWLAKNKASSFTLFFRLDARYFYFYIYIFLASLFIDTDIGYTAVDGLSVTNDNYLLKFIIQKQRLKSNE